MIAHAANVVDVALRALDLRQQEQLAQICGVVKAAPSNWRRKNRIPPRHLLTLIGVLRKKKAAIPKEFLPTA